MARAGARCEQHDDSDPVAAAAVAAAALRQRHATAKQPRRAAGPGDTPISDEQVAAIAKCLNRHGVEYVVIGGAASQLHGAPVPRTRDADIVPSKAGANLDRLAAALTEMDAKLWVGPDEPDGLNMTLDRQALTQVETFLNVITRYGPLDITYRPEGTDGFADLARSAVVVQLLGVNVPLASLEDVIRSKEAAGRAKDIAALPDLIEFSRRRRTAE